MDVTEGPRRAAAADLPRVHEVIAAAYARYRTRMERLPSPVLRDYAGHGLTRVRLYTHEVMTESQAVYARLGYRVDQRATEDGYRRIFMSKDLPG